MVDAEVWEGKIFRVHPLHRNKLGSTSTLYVLHKNIDAMIVMNIPEFWMMKSGLSPIVILRVDEFAEGVKAMKLVKDIFGNIRRRVLRPGVQKMRHSPSVAI
jgi:hypothetical protein